MARRHKDPTRLHGHHVVSGPELRATFAPDPEQAEPAGRFGRKLFHSVVLVLLLGVIAAGIVGAWAVLNGVIKVPATATGKPVPALCPTTTFSYLPNNKITVNVYNGTERAGLAGTVAEQLKARGYRIGTVGNKNANYEGTGIVVSGAAGQSAAFNMQRNVAATDYYQDQRTDSSVDVVLAPGFLTLLDSKLVDQTPGKLSCPRENQRVADDSRWPVVPAPVTGKP